MANSASSFARGVPISPGRNESVTEAAAAPPERAMTFSILSSVCWMECLWLSGSPARGAMSVMETAATRISSAITMIFFAFI